MSRTSVQTLLRAGRVSVADPATALRRFAAGDPHAFADLVDRYGPMVYGVCRRVLGPTPDADDAFQTTFLALAGHARSIRDPGSLAGWLHRTALNAARKARGGGPPPPGPVAEAAADDDPLAEASWREVRHVLDEELNALSATFRGPLVLCYLEARTHEDAARALGVSVSTLKRRLDRGRELLRARMVRRGVGAAGLATAVLGGQGLAAAVPAALLRAAVGRAVTGPPAARSGVLAAGLAVVAVALGGILLAAAGNPIRTEPPAAAGGPAPTPPGPPAGAGDRADDPLPDGAAARLGTGWLRGHRCRFSPDGKVVVRDRPDGGLQLFEVPTGRPLARIRGTDVPDRKEIIGSTVGFSPDGKLLAAALWEGRCGIWDTATGKLVRWLESGKFFSILKCTFSPDGTLLAVGDAVDHRDIRKCALGVYEVGSGRKLFTTPGTNGTFAPDGKSLVAWNGYGADTHTARRVSVPDGRVLTSFDYGNTPQANGAFGALSDGRWFFDLTVTRPGEGRRLRAWDVATGAVVHSFLVGGGDAFFLLRAPGKRELIAAGIKPDRIWCWDLDTGRELWRADLPGPAGYSRLSADGTTLVTSDRTAGTVTVRDAATGKVRGTLPVGSIGHGPFTLASPDGKTIATESGSGVASTAVAFWDVATGKLLSDLPGHASAITAATFAPGGKAAYTVGRDHTLRVWDPAAGRERARFAADPTEFLVASADGTTLFAAGPDGWVRALDVRTGKTVRRFRAFTRTLVGLGAAAGGTALVAGGRDEGAAGEDSIRVIDPATGRTQREFGRTAGGTLEQMAVRPEDGMVIASYQGREVVIWSPDGKRVVEHRGRGTRTAAWARGTTPFMIGSVAASPDGRWFAYSDQEAGVVILDARTGREEKRVRLPDVYFQNPAAREELRDTLAFAPDGKTVVWSGVESTADVYVIEARSGQVRRKLSGDSYPVRQLTFSPDGAALVSAGPDGSALVWDVAGRAARRPAGPPDPTRVAGWWDALGGLQAEKADASMREMVSHPAAAVIVLRERVKPVKPVEAARLDQLMARLSGADFDDREAATRELIALGDAAGPRLRTAVGSTDPETARRATAALNRIESAGRARAERAVEVLERIADPAAVGLLRELAGGMPGAALTADAAAALVRVSPGEKGPAR